MRLTPSGNSTIHQFVRVGRYAMVGGLSGIGKDVPPFMIQNGITQIQGLNLVGLRRAGFSSATITALKAAYRILYRMDLTPLKAAEQIAAEIKGIAEVDELVEFIRNSKRGICPHMSATQRRKGQSPSGRA